MYSKTLHLQEEINMPSPLRRQETLIPSEKDIQIAAESCRQLASVLGKKNKTFDFKIKGEKGALTISIPAPALRMLFAALTQMAQGNTVTLIPIHAELTTQEAANILNVSRPFLVNLLEENKIPHRKIGTRRKILFKDIMNYKDTMYKAREKSLDKLATDAQDLDMGY